jgi:hypothetical protein
MLAVITGAVGNTSESLLEHLDAIPSACSIEKL